MKNIHPVQQKLLQLLKKYQLNPLTMRELQEELGASSPSVVFHHITQLEKLGYLRRNPGNSKDYQIIGDTPEKLITYLNLYGMAQCGPNGSILDGNPIDQIPISSKILGFSSTDAFMVKAKGESMKPKINPGDLVIAKKSNKANNGDIIVCVNNEEVLIKKYQHFDKQILLTSFNQKFPTFIASSDFRIEGIVKSVFTYNPNIF
ncbi:MAG: S24 family peptidase [Candidatus Shapirobacteria bacterium]